MELVFSIVKWLFLGFFGLIGALVVFVLLFGKRVESRFDLEAQFRDDSGRETGEFDIKSWRYQKEGGDFQFKARFQWQDERLNSGDTVEVFLESTLVLKGGVETQGEIGLYDPHIENVLESAEEGHNCRVMLNSVLVMQQDVIHD